jgi:acetylornithine deacetylase
MSAAEDDLKARLLEALDDQQDWLIDTVLQLMRVRSTSGREAEAQEIVVRILKECDVDPEMRYLNIEFLQSSQLASPVRDASEERYNVIGETGRDEPGAGRLILSGHVDVLDPPAPCIWERDPYDPVLDPETGHIRGWGGLKAGLAAMLTVMRALHKAGVEPAGRLRIQSVVEEELGGNGALSALEGMDGFSAALVAGASGGAVHRGSVGVAWIQVRVFVNVSEWGQTNLDFFTAGHRLITIVRKQVEQREAAAPELFRKINQPLGFNLGGVEFPGVPSARLGEFGFTFRTGLYPSEDLETVMRDIRALLEQKVSEIFGGASNKVEVSVDGFSAPGYELHAPEFFESLADASRQAGMAAYFTVSKTVTDVRSFVANGIPAALVGPVVKGLHGITEEIEVEETLQSARAIAIMISQWCGLVEKNNNPKAQ